MKKWLACVEHIQDGQTTAHMVPLSRTRNGGNRVSAVLMLFKQITLETNLKI